MKTMDKSKKQKIIKIWLVTTIVWALILQNIFWAIHDEHESFPKKIISIITN